MHNYHFLCILPTPPPPSGGSPPLSGEAFLSLLIRNAYLLVLIQHPRFLFGKVECLLYIFYFIIIYRHNVSEIACRDYRARAVLSDLEAVKRV